MRLPKKVKICLTIYIKYVIYMQILDLPLQMFSYYRL